MWLNTNPLFSLVWWWDGDLTSACHHYQFTEFLSRNHKAPENVSYWMFALAPFPPMPRAIQIQSLLGGEKINRKQFLITTFHWISQNSVHRISSPSGHTIRKKKRRLQTIKKNEQKTDTNHSIFFCLHYKLHNPAHHSICVCVCTRECASFPQVSKAWWFNQKCMSR